MRVAALISGEPRFCKAFDMQLACIKNDEPIDWFFYLCNENESKNARYGAIIPPSLINCTNDQMADYINDRLPKNHKIACIETSAPVNVDHIKNMNYRTDSWQPPENIFIMFYNLNKVNNLKIEHEKKYGIYDLVIRTRPDVALLDYLDLNNIKNILDNNPNTVITPPDCRWGPGPTNDQFAIGTSDVMDRYSNILNNLDSLHNNGIPYHPETMLFHHLNSENIRDQIGNFYVPLRPFFNVINGVNTADFGTWA